MFMPSLVKLSVTIKSIMLSAIMLNTVMLNVVAPAVVLLSDKNAGHLSTPISGATDKYRYLWTIAFDSFVRGV
jgi:hypothetical protein